MKRISSTILAVLIGILLLALPALSADKGVFSENPVTNDGKKWRIGYYEGGEYIDYQKIFTETMRGLMKLGWIEYAEIPEQTGEQTRALWEWMSDNLKSDYLVFVRDAHYTAGWDDEARKQTRAAILDRLRQKHDIDLLIAMGTWAGKDMASGDHSTSTMVLSTSDPIAAGIIKSIEDSGYPHVHAQVDPFRYERQVRVFHEIVGFKKLGIAYEDSTDGRTYAAIDVVEKVAAERGFEVVRCHTKSDISDASEAELSVINCFSQLSEKADAIYVTVQGGVNGRSIPKLVQIANGKKIPTFSQSGSEEVKEGFFVSLSQAGFKYVGEFHASTFAKVFNGARPNELDQMFQEPAKIAINLKTSEIIGFDPPVVLLGAADEIYRDIMPPK
ncbi:ABC transporter substrate-binding protein [Desulfococcus sp.]|uniref:ABC transporter substrate-binding protein n=1 Tax=Desulfococcus sp. TaxID=2025834 RepID=UPI0035935436